MIPVMPFTDATLPERGATFSPDRKYRYVLWRNFDERPKLNVIGLNPSTADEMQDDPTIRRCIGFAKDWGYGGLVMTNLFGFRSTDPRGLRTVSDPVGPENNRIVWEEARKAGMAVAAWGSQPRYKHFEIADLMWSLPNPIYCFRLTKNGYPAHPLYLPKNLTPIVFEG